MRRSLLSLVVATLTCACSSSASPSGPPAGSPVALASVAVSSALVTPSLQPAPTESPTTNPSSTTPIEIFRALIALADKPFGVNGQTVVPIRNVGTSWIRIHPTASRYRIYAKDGRLLLDDSFPWSYPSDLGPGERGYLATYTQFPTGKAADVERIEVELSFALVDKADTVRLDLNKLVTKDYVEGRIRLGVVTTGTVTNPSSTILRGYDVGAFYFDAKGTFLGYTALNPGPLRAHETIGFETLPMAARTFDRAAVAKIEVFPASVCDVCPG